MQGMDITVQAPRKEHETAIRIVAGLNVDTGAPLYGSMTPRGKDPMTDAIYHAAQHLLLLVRVQVREQERKDELARQHAEALAAIGTDDLAAAYGAALREVEAALAEAGRGGTIELRRLPSGRWLGDAMTGPSTLLDALKSACGRILQSINKTQ